MQHKTFKNNLIPRPDLTGQVALITGGGQGLGRAFAQALAAAGAAVAVVGRSPKSLGETVASITTAGGRAISVLADVTEAEAVTRMANSIEDQLGHIDLLVNNAGTNKPLGRVWEVDADEWWQCIESNVRGPFLCAKALVPRMIARGRGRIINIGSTGGMRPIPYYSAYGTSKAALMRLTETLAAETKDYGLKVFAMHPGLLRTPMTEYLADSPEGRHCIPWVGRILSTGEEDPLTLPSNLILLLASGYGDSLSGRFLSVYDDVIELVKHQSEIQQEDWYTMRLRIPPAPRS